jgi:hypothetical protein
VVEEERSYCPLPDRDGPDLGESWDSGIVLGLLWGFPLLAWLVLGKFPEAVIWGSLTLEDRGVRDSLGELLFTPVCCDGVFVNPSETMDAVLLLGFPDL